MQNQQVNQSEDLSLPTGKTPKDITLNAAQTHRTSCVIHGLDCGCLAASGCGVPKPCSADHDVLILQGVGGYKGGRDVIELP